MNLILRIINNQKIPVLPSLTEKVDDKLTTTVKNDVLTHQEVDNNFKSLIQYIGTISDLLIKNTLKLNKFENEFSGSNNEQSMTLADVSAEIINIKNEINEINYQLRTITESLDRKIEQIKTINNQSLIGEGNIDVKIKRLDFISNLVRIKLGDIGSIGIFEFNSNDTLIAGKVYPASNLTTETLRGSWRCIGIVDSTHGLFIRVL